MNSFLITTIVILFIYNAISTIIGVYGVRSQNASDYITAPKKTGWINLSLTLVATVVGGGMFFGIAQEGYEKGLIAFSIGIAYFTGSIVLGLLAPALRRYAEENNVTTLFGVIDTLYPNRRNLFNQSITISKLFAFVCFVVFILMLSVQFVAIGTYVSFYTGTDFPLALIVGSVTVAIISTILYGFIGGFTRDVYTDVVQMIFIFIGVGVILYYLDLSNLKNEMQELPRELFTIRKGQLIEFFGALIFIPLTFLVRFDLWQRIITAKSNTQARNGFYISGVLSLLFFLFFCFLGLYARGIGVTDSKFAGLEVISRITLTPISAALAITMFCAAIISSADTFLGVAGISASKLLFYRNNELENPEESNSVVSLGKIRLITLIIGILALFFAYFIANIIDLFATAFGILLVFLPTFLMGFLAKTDSAEINTEHIHSLSWLSIVLGLVVITLLIYPYPREAWFPALVISCLPFAFYKKFKNKK
jgi:solute:Na+ symporter, SSS family